MKPHAPSVLKTVIAEKEYAVPPGHLSPAMKLAALALAAFAFVALAWCVVVTFAPFVDSPHPPIVYP